MAIIITIWGYFGKSTNDMIRLFLIFAIIFYLLYTGVLQSYNTLSNIAIWILGGGLPTITGALIRKTTKDIQWQSLKLLTIPAGLLCFSIFGYYFNLPFWSLAGGMSLLLIALVIPQILQINYKALRAQSMWIYYIHMYIIIIFMVISHQLDFTINRWIYYGIICGATWIIAQSIVLITKQPRLSALNKLIK